MKAAVIDTSGTTTKAFLHSITDSALYLMDMNQRIYTDVGPARLTKFDPAMIRSVNIRKKDGVLKGMGLGLLIGAVVGAGIGYASYNRLPGVYFDFGPGVEAAAGALVGGVIGTLGGIGVAIIIGPKRYKINGSIQNYQVMQERFYKRIRVAGK